MTRLLYEVTRAPKATSSERDVHYVVAESLPGAVAQVWQVATDPDGTTYSARCMGHLEGLEPVPQAQYLVNAIELLRDLAEGTKEVRFPGVAARTFTPVAPSVLRERAEALQTWLDRYVA